jgi:hypothetical protein
MQAGAAAPPSASDRQRYLRSESAFEVLRKSLRIYVRHFGVLFLTIVLPTLCFDVLTVVGKMKEHSARVIAGAVVSQFAAIFAFSAVCIVGSDICVGNKPSFRRAYRRIFGAPFGYVVANTLLVGLCLMGPFFLARLATRLNQVAAVLTFVTALVIGSWLALHLMYVPAISALEMKAGFRRALIRSSALGRGHRLRALWALAMVLMISGFIAVILWVLSAPLAAINSYVTRWNLWWILSRLLLLPLFALATLLMYYDLRSRKEAFDFPSRDETIHD